MIGRRQTKRLETDPIAKSKYDATAEADKLVVERVTEVAEKHSVPSGPHRLGLAVADKTRRRAGDWGHQNVPLGKRG